MEVLLASMRGTEYAIAHKEGDGDGTVQLLKQREFFSH